MFSSVIFTMFVLIGLTMQRLVTHFANAFDNAKLILFFELTKHFGNYFFIYAHKRKRNI